MSVTTSQVARIELTSAHLLTDCRKINLGMNQIEEIPEDIGNLQLLEELYISRNKIREVPASMEQMQSLRNLNLASNQIEALPVNSLLALPLDSFAIHNNPISFNITDSRLSGTSIQEFLGSLQSHPIDG